MGACNDVEIRRLFSDAAVFVGWMLRVRVGACQSRSRRRRNSAQNWNCGRHQLAVLCHTRPSKFPNRGRIAGPNGSHSGSRFDPRRISMATSTQLAELAQQHRMLEDELAEALQHPSVGDFTLAELKRRKLQLKDQMVRLAHSKCNSMPRAEPMPVLST
jgi:hypothetical protein